MTKQKIGVLVMSYGTPESMDQIEAYYTHIRRGRPPEPEQLQDLVNRYDAIVGGFFPLRKNTDRQVEEIEKTLNEQGSEYEFVCYQGLKHAKPFIEDGVEKMVGDGITKAIGVVLAPHYSTMSVGSYIKRAKEKAEELDLSINFVKSYHLYPKLIEVLSERVNTALQKFEGVDKNEVKILFSAHSLPEKILEINDPYPEQLMETSKKIAQKTGITNWDFAWQSAGQTAMPWLGPDILDVLNHIHSQENVQHVLICPIGFVSDHLEILYDIDIECQQVARKLGMHLERTESLNTDPRYMETVAEVVIAKLDKD
ncbi:ferrochelatase [Chengkuizengella marina]|uniref:Coproporphyrin III ferrochelatase n=1 Tax=Chengkuizengella marina TaxID=2507566 RepID=A0A6N9Q1A6_9BACL|nr:ferrochelatase [Chengkuizengella marina]NBI28785.1 ferrochelatase [Chengkuizengella marina]